MAKRHSSSAGLIPAVAYYRMTTDKQEASIPAQREAIMLYAATNGYEFTPEYIDEGVSGDETAIRRLLKIT